MIALIVSSRYNLGICFLGSNLATYLRREATTSWLSCLLFNRLSSIVMDNILKCYRLRKQSLSLMSLRS